MIGIERAEINELNKLNLKEYLLYFDRGNYRERANGTIVHKNKTELVIYQDHSYQFNTTSKPYKDNIGTLRVLYGWNFMETVDHLRRYRDRKEVPHYNLFDIL